MRHLGEALDKVRKSEYARLSGKQRRFIKGGVLRRDAAAFCTARVGYRVRGIAARAPRRLVPLQTGCRAVGINEGTRIAQRRRRHPRNTVEVTEWAVASVTNAVTKSAGC
jgi:hypothetical protein